MYKAGAVREEDVKGVDESGGVFAGDAARGGVMSGGVIAYLVVYVVIFVFMMVIFVFWC